MEHQETKYEHTEAELEEEMKRRRSAEQEEEELMKALFSSSKSYMKETLKYLLCPMT
jgi:hypothetical protein